MISQHKDLTSQHKDLTSQHKDLTRRHKDLTSQHNYLTNDGRNMPPYRSSAMQQNHNFLLLSGDHLCTTVPVVRYCFQYFYPKVRDWQEKTPINGLQAAIPLSHRLMFWRVVTINCFYVSYLSFWFKTKPLWSFLDNSVEKWSVEIGNKDCVKRVVC